MGLAAAGLAVWGGWKLGKYLAHIALEEIETSHAQATDLTTEKLHRKPLWKRQFSPVS
jgi:hypothetical protein